MTYNDRHIQLTRIAVGDADQSPKNDVNVDHRIERAWLNKSRTIAKSLKSPSSNTTRSNILHVHRIRWRGIDV
jgi:hypothetical protein